MSAYARRRKLKIPVGTDEDVQLFGGPRDGMWMIVGRGDTWIAGSSRWPDRYHIYRRQLDAHAVFRYVGVGAKPG